jgi:hypothetical protein
MQLVRAVSRTVEIKSDPDGGLAVDFYRLNFSIHLADDEVTVTRGPQTTSIPLLRPQAEVLLEEFMIGNVEAALQVLVRAGLTPAASSATVPPG